MLSNKESASKADENIPYLCFVNYDHKNQIILSLSEDQQLSVIHDFVIRDDYLFGPKSTTTLLIEATHHRIGGAAEGRLYV